MVTVCLTVFSVVVRMTSINVRECSVILVGSSTNWVRLKQLQNSGGHFDPGNLYSEHCN